LPENQWTPWGLVVSAAIFGIPAVSGRLTGGRIRMRFRDFPGRAMKNKQASKNVRFGKGTSFSLKIGS
jgi:hypothetical protein